MPKVVIANEKKEIEVPEGSNLRTEAQKAGVEIYNGLDKYLNCRGNGLCGTCKIYVKKGMENVSPKSRIERIKLALMFSSIGHEEEIRLACQCQINGDCTIETCPEFNLSGENFWQKPYPNK
ncbi:MAG: 2Fe-2S iron-sulfur cluster-binding protein [Gemmataceae bacterium]